MISTPLVRLALRATLEFDFKISVFFCYESSFPTVSALRSARRFFSCRSVSRISASGAPQSLTVVFS